MLLIVQFEVAGDFCVAAAGKNGTGALLKLGRHMIHDHHLERLLLLAAVEGGLALVRHVLAHYFIESGRGLKQVVAKVIVLLGHGEGGCWFRLPELPALPQRIGGPGLDRGGKLLQVVVFFGIVGAVVVIYFYLLRCILFRIYFYLAAAAQEIV